MKNLFETFKKSIHNPAFYQSVAEAPLSRAVGFYIKFALLFSLVMTIAVSAFLVPQGVSFVKNHAQDLVTTYYPKDLEIRIENGIASTNVSMPYFVSLSKIFGVATSSNMQNVLVIDTTKDFDIKKFQEYKTYALLTSNEIVTMDSNGRTTIQPLRNFPTSTINQELLLSWVQNTQNYLGVIVTIGIILMFIIIMFGYLAYLIPLLLFAFVPKVIAYIKKENLTYPSAYKMSLYAIVPALALKTLLNILGLLFLPGYFTLLVFMLIIAVNMRDEETPTLFNK